MKSQFAMAICCCDEVEPGNPCPCQSDTVTDTADLHISGVTMYSSWYDLNGTKNVTNQLQGSFAISGCMRFLAIARTPFTTGAWMELIYTRADSALGFALSTGVKAVVRLSQIYNFDPTHASAAWFEKVISPNKNIYVPCDEDLTGFTFVGQAHSNPSVPVFDASGATITYS